MGVKIREAPRESPNRFPGKTVFSRRRGSGDDPLKWETRWRLDSALPAASERVLIF